MTSPRIPLPGEGGSQGAGGAGLNVPRGLVNLAEGFNKLSGGGQFSSPLLQQQNGGRRSGSFLGSGATSEVDGDPTQGMSFNQQQGPSAGAVGSGGLPGTQFAQGGPMPPGVPNPGRKRPEPQPRDPENTGQGAGNNEGPHPGHHTGEEDVPDTGGSGGGGGGGGGTGGTGGGGTGGGEGGEGDGAGIGDISQELLDSILAFLQQPSRFDMEAVQAFRDQQMGELNRQAEMARGRVNADAASRGLFFGSPASQAMAGVESDLQRGIGEMESQLALEQARTQGQDRQRAFSTAMALLSQQQGAEQFMAQLAAQMLGMGMQGGPNLSGTQNLVATTPGLGGSGGSFGSDLGQFGQMMAMISMLNNPGGGGNNILGVGDFNSSAAGHG